ncbi:MAG: gliding motility lipoprotein GldB, partial [Bacteroidota bacterium]
MKLMLKLVIVGCFISCGKADKVESEIAKIEVDLRVKRFDSAFAKSTPDDLPKLKNEYPYLFPAQFSDSLWISRMTDTLQQELAAEVLKHFPELNREKDEFYALFQHARYYFPDFKPPKLITLTADVDYKNKVIYADSLLLIGLDTYLGESHYFYKGIQQYLKKNFTRSQIVVDAALQIAKARTPYPQDRSFLAQMVFYGKLLYVKDMFLPDK